MCGCGTWLKMLDIGARSSIIRTFACASQSARIRSIGLRLECDHPRSGSRPRSGTSLVGGRADERMGEPAVRDEPHAARPPRRGRGRSTGSRTPAGWPRRRSASTAGPCGRLPRAFASSESGPCSATMAICEDVVRHPGQEQHHAVQGRRAAVAKWFSPIQPVANGTSDSQNSRCRFAQSIRPLMPLGRVQQVVVVVPVDAEEDEAQHVGEEHRERAARRAADVGAVRHAAARAP